VARILIVEDEERIASFVAKGLRADGHTTAVATDGHVGLDRALSGDFDLVVLDIGLPGLDGFSVLEQLRAQGSRVPVIVLTARDSVGDTVSAMPEFSPTGRRRRPGSSAGRRRLGRRRFQPQG